MSIISKMTYLTSRHVRLIKFLVYFSLLAAVNAAALKEPTLLESITQQRCGFPPLDLKIPPKCSELTLSSPVKQDLHNKDNAEFYLCTALLDSTNRLCPLVNKNRDFRERVESALNDSLPTLMVSDGGRFCAEMTVLDPNTTMEQAKFIYSRMKPLFCVSICVGMDDSESALREPLCKSIQFAHQQIRAAIELQKKLNTQDQKPEKDGTPVEANTAIVNNSTSRQSLPGGDQSHSSANAQSSPTSNAQATNHESNTADSGASNVKATKNKTPSESQPIDSTLPHSKDITQDPKTYAIAITPPKKNEAKAPGNLPAPAPAPESNVNKPVNVEEAPKPDQETPDLSVKADEQTEDFKGEVNQGRNDQTVDDANPEAEDTEGLEDMNMKPDDTEDDDLAGNGVQEPNRDVAEKPPAVERKISKPDAPVPLPQLKVNSGLISGGQGNFEESEDSHFFAYFMSVSALCILGYLVYHNKRKIIAMAVEGKKGRNTGRRRPNSASYHKLDSNLEEAMSSNLASTNSYVIY